MSHFNDLSLLDLPECDDKNSSSYNRICSITSFHALYTPYSNINYKSITKHKLFTNTQQYKANVLLKIKTSESQIALSPQLCLLTVTQNTELQTANLLIFVIQMNVTIKSASFKDQKKICKVL
jgi:hypothetical protein